MSYADSVEEEEKCFFVCVCVCLSCFKLRKVFLANYSAEYPQVPLARIGHMHLPKLITAEGSETAMIGFDQP